MHTRSRPEVVDTLDRSGVSHRFIIECGLYTTSVIVGAGILGLPTLTAAIGLLPGLGLTLSLGIGLTFVYARIAAAVQAAVHTHIVGAWLAGMPVLQRAGVHQDDLPTVSRILGPYLVHRKGTGILDAIFLWLGYGRAGKAALTAGLVSFVVPAMILYIVSGGMALSAIANHLRTMGTSATLLWTAAAGSLAISLWASRSPLAALPQMLASWLGAIALLMTFPSLRPLSLLLFGATIAGVVLRTTVSGRGMRSGTPVVSVRGQIDPAHQLGALLALINLLLIAVTGAIGLLVLHDHDGLTRPQMIAPDLDAGGLAQALGGLLFAFTGTGVFNLIKYPALFEHRTRSGRTSLGTVILIGTLTATAAYAGWMVATSFMLAPSLLVQTDNERGYATIPLAAMLSDHGLAGWIVFISGYTVALLTVTCAGLGFSEALADRLARIAKARDAERQGDSFDTSDTADAWRSRAAQLSVLALGTGMAYVLQAMGEAFSFRDILAVAGYAGGGLLVLVLPFFLPQTGQHRSSGRAILVVTVIAIGLAILNVLEMPENFARTTEATIAGSVVIAFDVMFVTCVLWLLRDWRSASTSH